MGSPGVGGYVLAVAVSACALGVVLLIGALPEALGDEGGEDLLILPTGVLVVTLYALFFAVPLAPPGVLLVHLLCLRVRHQAVHVLAAGLAGAAAALVWVRTSGVGGDPGWFPLQLAVATACGRAAVVPLARRRRASRPPVEDDSRDHAARC